jgi:hypothetical protein
MPAQTIFDDPAAIRRRCELLFQLIAEPDVTAATSVANARMHRPELRRADFADVLELLQRESNELIARLRRGASA